MERARRFVDAVGARYVFPTAGPPCFLDDDLFEHNDFVNSPDNIFPDQTVFLAYLTERGSTTAGSSCPGATATLSAQGCEVTHRLDEDELASVFARQAVATWRPTRTRQATRSSRRRSAPGPATTATCSRRSRTGSSHCCRWRTTSARASARPVLLDLGEEKILIDFPARAGAPLCRRGVPLPLHASTGASSKPSSRTTRSTG